MWLRSVRGVLRALRSLVRRITKTLSRPGRKGNTVSMGGGESFLKASVGSFVPDIREASRDEVVVSSER